VSFGSPIVFNEDIQERRFIPLAGISARRDDPNSFNESLLQELIDATPNVLPVREYLWAMAPCWIPYLLDWSLSKSHQILDASDGGFRMD